MAWFVSSAMPFGRTGMRSAYTMCGDITRFLAYLLVSGGGHRVGEGVFDNG
jgi:hypothetical protein